MLLAVMRAMKNGTRSGKLPRRPKSVDMLGPDIFGAYKADLWSQCPVLKSRPDNMQSSL